MYSNYWWALTTIINRLSNSHPDVELKDTLKLSYIDRIRLNFTAEQFNGNFDRQTFLISWYCYFFFQKLF